MSKKKKEEITSNNNITNIEKTTEETPVKESARTAEDFGFMPVDTTPLNLNTLSEFQPVNLTPVFEEITSSPIQESYHVRKAPDARIKQIIDELENQFRSRMEKLGLGNSVDDASATQEEKMKWYMQRDEFIGRELFRKYGYEDFICFADGIAVSDYWNDKVDYMRPCNAYNGSCRMDCPFLEDGKECPQRTF